MMTLEPGRAVHATAIVIGETGILFTGKSGAGKTATALACIDAARQRGWHAALVADDGVVLECTGEPGGGRIIAHCPPSIAGRAEIRGSGIVAPPWRPAALIHLVVSPGAATGEGRLPPENAACRIGGARLPLVFLRYDGSGAPLQALQLLAIKHGICNLQWQLG